MSDVGIELQSQQFQFLKERSDNFLVVDSGDLLNKPKEYLTEICTRLGIDFKEGMISWPKGPIAEDGVWAKYWYSNVHKSTGFSPRKTSTRAFPEHCRKLLEEAEPHYNEISKYALKI